MKKNPSIKNLLKSPPISVKAFKSSQKFISISNDVNQSQSMQQMMKNKIENMNKNLNQEIKQRQFEFKELYKMILDLQKSKKSKCKHSIVVMQRNNITTNNDHLPITVLHKDLNNNITDERKQLNSSQKNIISIYDSNKSNLLMGQNSRVEIIEGENIEIKKQKRKSKCGIIKSHKHLPGVNNSCNSNVDTQIQNEQEICIQVQKSQLKFSKSQLFNSTSETNFNLSHHDMLSPIKSATNLQKCKKEQQIELKLNYLDTKLKSLETSQTFIKEKVDTHALKHDELIQQIKTLDLKLQNQIKLQLSQKKNSEQLQNKVQDILSSIDHKMRQIKERFQCYLKTFDSQLVQKVHNQLNQSGLKKKIQKIEELIYEEFKNIKNQTQLYIGKVEKSISLEIEENQQKNKIISQEMQRLSLKGEKLQKCFQQQIQRQKSSQENQQKMEESFCQAFNNSPINSLYQIDKYAEIMSRLESTEQVVSELMKVSLTLTTKINNFDLEQGKLQERKKGSKNIHQPTGLSEGYWLLKEQLNRIDEQPLESSQQVIDSSLQDINDNSLIDQICQILQNQNVNKQ